MVMEILTLMGNVPRTGCVSVSKTWKKKFRKNIVIFIINATEILPHVKISHENNIFFWKNYHANTPFLENLPCKLPIFGKSTMKIRSFWKIYHANKIFLENLPFHGNIPMELNTNGKFPCLFGYA
jgi:hypothetical protein